MKQIALLLTLVLMACGKTEGRDTYEGHHSDPTVLVDTYERENWFDCEGKVNVDKTVRRAAVNTIKMNPKRNIPINSSSFFNLDTNDEFTPDLGWFRGPGGDNYKFVSFCQPPKVKGCNMAVLDGENRIEYKYWSYQYEKCNESPSGCKKDVLEEQDIRFMKFTHVKYESKKICKRFPKSCPLTNSTTWGECNY